jgi:hypothetical protein
MTITVTGFERPPDRARGLADDMQVCWTLEGVCQTCISGIAPCCFL